MKTSFALASVLVSALSVIATQAAYAQGGSSNGSQIVVIQNINSTRTLHFSEESPGVPDGEILSDGCEIHNFGSGKTIRSGVYTVIDRSVSEPSVWDRRTHVVYRAELNGNEIRVACKRNGSISSQYINRLLSGYARVR